MISSSYYHIQALSTWKAITSPKSHILDSTPLSDFPKPQPQTTAFILLSWPGILCSSASICPNLSLKSAPPLAAWAETLKDDLLLKLTCPFSKEKSLYLILSSYLSLSGELVSKALENLHRIERNLQREREREKPAWNGVFNMENYSPSFQCQRYSFYWDWY